MATGGYYIAVKGLDELVKGLKTTPGGFKDLRRINEKIVRRATVQVKQYAPLGHRSRKDSKVHPWPGNLKRHIFGKWGPRTAAVWAQDVPYLTVQEFGGSSVWHRYGRGFMRQVNRGHLAYSNVKVSGKLGRSHMIYYKQRKLRGYFIWNEAYRLRSYIARTYSEGVCDICKEHGLGIEMASNPTLNIKETIWSGGKSA